MNQEYSIAKLNTLIKIRLASSKIHGIGVFAMRNIPKGTKLYTDIPPEIYHIPYGSLDKLFPEVKELLLGQWPQIVNGSKFAYPTERFQAFMNHSETPNYNAQKDETLQDIYKDDEITENYKLIPNWEKAFPWLL